MVFFVVFPQERTSFLVFEIRKVFFIIHFQTLFCFQKPQNTVFKNHSQTLFFKTIFKKNS